MVIDEIQTIIKFIDKAKVNHLEVFTREDFGENKTKMGTLFQMLLKNEYTSLDTLKFEVMGIEKKDWGFKKLMQRFKEKLSNTLLLVDTNSSLFNERSKAYYNCAKRSMVSRMLNERGAVNSAAELAEMTIPIAIKYEFTDISLMLLRYLLRFLSSQNQPKKFLKYFELFEKVASVYEKEIEMEQYIQLQVVFANSKSNTIKKNLITKNLKIEQVVDKVKSYINKESSLETLRASSNFVLNYFYENSNFAQYKKYANLTVELVQLKPFFSPILLETTLINYIKVGFISKDVSVCTFIDQEYSTKIRKDQFNWFTIQLYYTLTLLHAKKYKLSMDRLSFILSQKTFKSQPPIITEQFIIIQAYLYFIENLNKKTPAKDGEFRINKFLNQVPEYSKDKEGTNISILLIQILYFLKEDKYSKIIDRLESLKLYSYRHLRKDENFRSQCLFRMLNEMAKADFRKKGTEFRTEKLLAKLKSVPIETFPNAAEREIIPYEDLWELILGHLK